MSIVRQRGTVSFWNRYWRSNRVIARTKACIGTFSRELVSQNACGNQFQLYEDVVGSLLLCLFFSGDDEIVIWNIVTIYLQFVSLATGTLGMIYSFNDRPRNPTLTFSSNLSRDVEIYHLQKGKNITGGSLKVWHMKGVFFSPCSKGVSAWEWNTNPPTH